MESIKFIKETPIKNLNMEITDILKDRHSSNQVITKINGNNFQLNFCFENRVKGLKIYKAETEKIFGKKLNANVMLTLPSKIENILETEFENLKVKEEEEKNLYIEKILSGEEIITATYYEGSPLSGHMIDNIEAEKLLRNLKLVEDISGWGTIIDHKFIEAVGENFTYLQALEYVRPEREKAEEKKAIREEKINKAIKEAQKTGEPVEVARYTDDCDDPTEECSTDLIIQYVSPDGSMKTKRQHTW